MKFWRLLLQFNYYSFRWTIYDSEMKLYNLFEKRLVDNLIDWLKLCTGAVIAAATLCSVVENTNEYHWRMLV